MKHTPGGRPLGDLPSCISRIESAKDRLTQSERRIAQFILESPGEFVSMSVGQAAELLSTSKATLVRFSKKLGYEGYGALRMVVARDLGENQQEVYAQVTQDDSPAEMVGKTFNHAIGGLRDTLSALKPDTLLDAAQSIRNSSSMLVIGMGGSGGMAVVAQHRIGRLGILVHVCMDAHALPVISSALPPHDVVLAITHTGMTEPIVEALKDAKRAGASTIAICNNPVSPVAKIVDHLLLTGVGPTPIEAEAGSSRIAQAAVIDALTVILQFSAPSGDDRAPR